MLLKNFFNYSFNIISGPEEQWEEDLSGLLKEEFKQTVAQLINDIIKLPKESVFSSMPVWDECSHLLFLLEEQYCSPDSGAEPEHEIVATYRP